MVKRNFPCADHCLSHEPVARRASASSPPALASPARHRHSENQKNGGDDESRVHEVTPPLGQPAHRHSSTAIRFDSIASSTHSNHEQAAPHRRRALRHRRHRRSRGGQSHHDQHSTASTTRTRSQEGTMTSHHDDADQTCRRRHAVLGRRSSMPRPVASLTRSTLLMLPRDSCRPAAHHQGHPA